MSIIVYQNKQAMYFQIRYIKCCKIIDNKLYNSSDHVMVNVLFSDIGTCCIKLVFSDISDLLVFYYLNFTVGMFRYFALPPPNTEKCAFRISMKAAKAQWWGKEWTRMNTITLEYYWLSSNPQKYLRLAFKIRQIIFICHFDYCICTKNA